MLAPGLVTKQTHIYIQNVYIHAAWLLTSCLAEIPQNAATIKCSFCFNRVPAANVKIRQHTQNMFGTCGQSHNAQLAMYTYWRSRSSSARGVLSNEFEATHAYTPQRGVMVGGTPARHAMALQKYTARAGTAQEQGYKQ